MSAPRHVAVIDIGKTNVKLALVDLAARREIAVETRPNAVLPGPPYPHFDVEGHWDFLLGALAAMNAGHGVDAIAVTTHGASGALLAADGTLAAPVLDYEHDGPDTLTADYDALRPAFSETGSPRLPLGLNLGAQIHWQLRRDPGLADRVAHVVTWPQYWSFRLTGRLATDLTSLGCHTDLWLPFEGRPSPLLERLGLGGRLAPAHRPGDVLGTIGADIAARTGLPPGTPVTCGIHDSNASLLPHLIGRPAPFAVVSTGTWVIAMAVGGAAQPLDPGRDTLVNVDAFGAPVPSARFMGGREYEIVRAGTSVTAAAEDEAAVLRDETMLLPAVQPGSGPFPRAAARWVGGEPAIGSGAREAALGFYLALMTACCLEMIGAAGPVLVEGPFGRNGCYRRMLAAATGRDVIASPSQTGTAIGAALLFADPAATPAGETTGDVTEAASVTPGHVAYATAWRGAVSG